MTNWVEERPKEGDIIRFPFNGQTEIGIFIRYSDGRLIIDIGERVIWLLSGTQTEVYKPN